MLKIKTARRAVALILVMAAMIAALAGCGTKSRASEEAISAGQNAIAVVDRYLDGIVDADEAVKKLDSLCRKMDYLDDMTSEDDHFYADHLIKGRISSLSTFVYLEDFAKIKSTRNELAADVGEKKR